MEEGRRNQLETKLKKMLKQFDEAKAKRKQRINQSDTGNIIRRREGQKDKRFAIEIGDA